MKEPQKELQIYKKGRVYALVDKNGNYSVNVENEEGDIFTNFHQDGSWKPVEYEDMPSWFKQQIEDFQLFESDDDEKEV